MRAAAFILAVLWACAASAAGSGGASGSQWKAQFANGVRWSTLGVVDDSGVTDNTAALNALPANVPILGDCPNNGYVSFNGSWTFPSGLLVWQQPGCVLQSTITTIAVYPFVGPASLLAATPPITNVQYYGAQWKFATPTSTVRFFLGWIDHFKFEYFALDGGCFGFLRGSDQEIAFGWCINVPTAVGNPGLRQLGNMPKVATSPGMHANNYYHNLNFSTGDATYQACQPNTNATLWTYAVSTDDLLYENVWGTAASSSLFLVNEALSPTAATNFTCNGVTLRNITGVASGTWFGIISSGNDNTVTSNITVQNATYNGSTTINSLRSLGIGTVTRGGVSGNSTHTSGIVLQNISVSNALQGSLEIQGPILGLLLSNSTMGAPRTPSGNNVSITAGVVGCALSGNTLSGAVDTSGCTP